VTLIFGIFALLVYWATNPPREENEFDGETSFTPFASYIIVIIGSVIFGGFITAILGSSIEHMETYSDRSQSIGESILWSGLFLSVATGLVGNLLRRHAQSEESDTFPTGVSPFEFRIIGAFSILSALPVIGLSRTVIFQAYTIIQSLVGVLFALLAISIIVVSIWSLELGRPIEDLYSMISQTIK
jgi:hypothetical protein